MAQLYSRLGSVGFPRKYLREIVLPDWWKDEIAHNPAGYTEGLMILSRNLGLDLASTQNEAMPEPRYPLPTSASAIRQSILGGGFLALANAALRVLEPHADAVALVRSSMIAHLGALARRIPLDIRGFVQHIGAELVEVPPYELRSRGET